VCDTVCKIGEGVTFFAKNSDREPNEAQYVEYYPSFSREKSVKATYMEVEYDGRVNAIIISRPFWMWGAEMGVNEFGVAIGNESVFSKHKMKERKLLGMDLLRIALEKSRTAKDASGIIIEYLEKYGQGGSNSARTELYYDNSFMITDRNESYILETEGTDHTLTKGALADSISNFPFARDYEKDVIYSSLGKGKYRQEKTRRLVGSAGDVGDLMDIMRSHHDGFTHPADGNNGDICMHGGFLTRRFQTVNSMIVELKDGYSVVWSTYSSNPCISLYKPVIFKGGSVIGGLPLSSGYWEGREINHIKIIESGEREYSIYHRETVDRQVKMNAMFADLLGKLSSDGGIEEDEVRKFNKVVENMEREIDGLVSRTRETRYLYRVWLNRELKSLRTSDRS